MRKKFLPIFGALAVSLATVGCSSDDPISPGPEPTPEPGKDIVKSGILKSNETWTANNIYVLDGRVVVDEGVTLTIEPGTIIKAEDGQEANATTLIVDQGGKLVANGTADKPIIFTSVNDQIKVGEKKSTLKPGDAGQWGGVILLGKAPISVAASSGKGYVEGIPAGLSYGEYGGTDAADNSGSLKYVSIRYSGTVVATNSEIQGLTLGGVGNGTTIENIEIFSNKDDGIEFFGGTVNVKNVVVYGQEDDGLDIDQAYAGTIDNALVIQTEKSDSGLEIDGPEGNAVGAFTLKNITINMSNLAGKKIADFRDGATGKLENVYVSNINAGGNVVNVNDEKSVVTFNGSKISFARWEMVLPTGKTIANLLTSKGTTAIDASKFTSNAIGVTAGSQTVGANISAFDWTFTKASDLLK
ncbi:MAG: hypothetical protein LBF27_04145 [Sphingobacterium sp.]|nr:hypothetical protein [Sphingobacterium sp.]